MGRKFTVFYTVQHDMKNGEFVARVCELSLGVFPMGTRPQHVTGITRTGAEEKLKKYVRELINPRRGESIRFEDVSN